jgi:hypothetical protein
MKRILIMAALLAMVMGACAPAAPTIDPAQIQASAIAAASTMIAMTKAAFPTPTLVPPTPPPSPTPLPSPTFMTLPTLLPLGVPSVAAGTADPCDPNKLLPLVANPDAGPKTTIKILNDTKAPITLSLFLNKTTLGECGYVGQNLGAHATTILNNLPQGCYSAFAFIKDSVSPSQSVSLSDMCMDSDDEWTIVVGTEVIKLNPP